VRQLEKMAAESEKPEEVQPIPQLPSYYREMEISLHERLARKVKVDYKKNKGTLTLEFYDEDDLRALAEKLVQEL
jgi:ParB family chromosome partitioning protein